MRRLYIGCMAFIMWLMLTWPFGSDTGYQSLFIGAAASIFVAMFFGDYLPGVSMKFFEPKRYLWALYYTFIFLCHCIAANFDVAYRIIHPDMPIKPGVIKVKTNLKNIIGLAVLANSITLTPGTTTIDLTDNGYLYIHWINVKTQDEHEARKIIVERFEKILTRMFE